MRPRLRALRPRAGARRRAGRRGSSSARCSAPRSPVTTHTPLLGAEVLLATGTSLELDVDEAFEHGVLLDVGVVDVDGQELKPQRPRLRRARPYDAHGDRPRRAGAAAAARRPAVRRADRDVVELRRPQPRRDRRLPRGVAGPDHLRRRGRRVRHRTWRTAASAASTSTSRRSRRPRCRTSGSSSATEAADSSTFLDPSGGTPRGTRRPSRSYSRTMGEVARTQRLADAAAAFTSNARNPDLRRAQLSFLGAWTAEWAFTVGARHRGLPRRRRGRPRPRRTAADGAVRGAAHRSCRPSPTAAGASGSCRGRLDRCAASSPPPRRSVAALGGPPAVVYALAVLSTIAATLFRPAHSALLPSLCHTGHELASANVVRGMLDSARHPRRARSWPPCCSQVADVDVVFAVAAARVALGGGAAAAAAVRRPAAPVRADAAAPRPGGRRGAGRGRAEPRPGPGPRPRRRPVPHPWGAHRASPCWSRSSCSARGEPGAGTLMTAVGVGAVLGSLGGLAARRHPAPRRLVRARGHAVGAPARPRRRPAPAGRRRSASWRSSASATR